MFFNVSEDRIQSIYSKLATMRVFDVYANILKCMKYLRSSHPWEIRSTSSVFWTTSGCQIMLPWDLEMTVEEPLSDDEDEDGVPHCVSDSESESENDSD
jgi:hypothetical protein